MALRKKNIKTVAVLFIAAATLFAGLFYYGVVHNTPLTKNGDNQSVFSVKKELSENESAVFLYFCDRKRPVLVAEERILSHSEDPVLFGRAIIDALLRGPQNGMMRSIPVTAELNALYITQNKTAFVDFSREIRENHPGGSQMEYLTVYSIVNSLVLNIQEIEKVKILVEGQEAETLAGHIAIRDSLSANMLLVR